MKFSTPIPIPNSNHPIDYHSGIVLLGSCFSENIGAKFEYFKFQNTINPFGIIFNTVSIEKLLWRIVNRDFFSEEDVFFHNDLWHCYEVHSELSHSDKEVFLNTLNRLLESAHNQIAEASHIIITYGTSWVYRLKSSENIVANCHKVPQSQFDKLLLSVADNEAAIQNTIALLHQTNPNCQVLFTVSPVRHSKDGFVENQRSKAHLITAIHNLQLSYFPSYEILMDELRDYRFYAEDMLHPNQTAINYIWQRFAETHIAPAAVAVMDEVAAIQKGLAHRPFNPETATHQKFLMTLHQKITKLQVQFPHLQF